MVETGFIQSIDDNAVTVVVPLKKPYIIEKQDITQCEVRFDDGRIISAEQRKKIYATIRDIADYTGDVPEYIKDMNYSRKQIHRLHRKAIGKIKDVPKCP